MGSTRHNSQLYIHRLSINLARFEQFLPIDKIFLKLKFHQHTLVIPTKAGANATAQGGICCFHPPCRRSGSPKQKARPIGRAFPIFTLYIQNIKLDGVHPPQFPTLYPPSFHHLSPIRALFAPSQDFSRTAISVAPLVIPTKVGANAP